MLQAQVMSIDIYVKDLNISIFLLAVKMVNLGSISGLTVNGKPEASFNSEENDCGIFTFTNTSISGELVE